MSQLNMNAFSALAAGTNCKSRPTKHVLPRRNSASLKSDHHLISPAPQVEEGNTPRSMDVDGEHLSYDDIE